MAAQPFATQQLHGSVHRVASVVPSNKPSRFLSRPHVQAQHMLHAAKIEEAASAQVCFHSIGSLKANMLTHATIMASLAGARGDHPSPPTCWD